MYGIIYKITNLINSKIYIGQTTQDMICRFEQHCRKDVDKGGVSAVTTAIKKYGKENFKIEQIDSANSQDELNEKEICWIKELNSMSPDGYNLKLGGKGGKLSEETILKMKASLMGRKITKESLEKRKMTRSMRSYPKLTAVQRNRGPKCGLYKGIRFCEKNKHNKFLAEISVDKKRIHLGSHRTEIEAAFAYNFGVDKYLNGFGYKNVINDFELYTEINKTRELRRTGVSYRNDVDLWSVYVFIDKNRINIGLYKSELDAKIAYNDYVIRNNLDKPLNWTDGKWLI